MVYNKYRNNINNNKKERDKKMEKRYNPCETCAFGELEEDLHPCDSCWAADSHYININRCKYHHTSKSFGYVGVNERIIEPYSGRFGKGYIIKKHNPHSTRFYLKEYYIFE